jgi:cardiolipin synthase
MRSPLGSFLDPLADKVLLVSIYVTLGIVAALPSWLVILVVSRDVLIVGAVLLTWVMGETVESRPLMISKINTAAQIVLAALVLGDDAFRLDGQWLVEVGVFAVAGLTIASGGAYVAGWLRTMSATPDAPGQRQSRRSEDAGAAPNPETPP